MDRHCWNLLSYGWKHKKAQTCKESVCFSVSGCVSMWFCCDCNWLQLHVWLLGCCVALLQIYGRARSSTNLHEQAWRCLSLHCDVFELSQKRNQVQCNNVPISHCFNQCRQAGVYGKLRVCRSLDFQFVLTKRRTTFIFDLRRRRLQTMSFKMNASLGGKNVAFRQCFVSYYGKYKKNRHEWGKHDSCNLCSWLPPRHSLIFCFFSLACNACMLWCSFTKALVLQFKLCTVRSPARFSTTPCSILSLRMVFFFGKNWHVAENSVTVNETVKSQTSKVKLSV